MNNDRDGLKIISSVVKADPHGYRVSMLMANGKKKNRYMHTKEEAELFREDAIDRFMQGIEVFPGCENYPREKAVLITEQDGKRSVVVRTNAYKSEPTGTDQTIKKMVAGSRPLIAGGVLPELDEFDGSSKWWKKTISAVVLSAHKAANELDPLKLEVLKKYSAIVHQCSSSSIPHSNHEEVEAELEKMIRFQESLEKNVIEEDAQELNARQSLDQSL